MTDEYWTTREGKRIAVGEMDQKHVRNALRMVLRTRRKLTTRFVMSRALENVNPQDLLNDQHREDLRNPTAFFPLLEGGVHGSEELWRRHGGKI